MMVRFVLISYNRSFPSPGTDDEPHEYSFLTAWGPRFDKLVNIYEPKLQIEDDDVS